MTKPISIIMGSKSDWATMQKQLKPRHFGVAYEKESCLLIGHRTLMFKHAEEARSRGIGHHRRCWWRCSLAIVMVAAKTTLPVIGTSQITSS